ncbi:hypothetical protein [Mycolicibacter sinensis]
MPIINETAVEPLQPGGTGSVYPGAYQWLVEHYEADHERWAGSVHGRAPGTRYPMTYLLGKLRAGQPVSVERRLLPVEFGGVPRPRTARELAERTPAQTAAALSIVQVTRDDRVVAGVADPQDVFDEYANL